MKNEQDIEHVTPSEGPGAAVDDADEILRGAEKRLEARLVGVRETRRRLGLAAASERSTALRELAGILGEDGDAWHLARHAVEYLAAAQLGTASATHRDLPAHRRPRLKISWGHVSALLTGAGLIVAGTFMRSETSGQVLIATGAAMVAGTAGHSSRRRSE